MVQLWSCRLTEEGAECEFWGERIAGGTPRTGLEPFPPWYCRAHRHPQSDNLLKVHYTSTESTHYILQLVCTQNFRLDSITFISATFSCLKNSVKNNGFCILEFSSSPSRDDCIPTSRFNTEKHTERKEK